MTFNETLRNLIEERGITQKRLAGDLNIAVSTMGGYVQGTSEPDFGTLKTLATYFNVSVDYLLGVKSPGAKNDDENDLLRIFRSLTEQQRQMYLEQGKAILRVNAKEKTSSPGHGANSKHNAS